MRWLRERCTRAQDVRLRFAGSEHHLRSVAAQPDVGQKEDGFVLGVLGKYKNEGFSFGRSVGGPQLVLGRRDLFGSLTGGTL